MAVPGYICFLYVQFSAGSLLSRSKTFKNSYLTLITSRHVIQLISFSWGAAVAFIFLLLFFLVKLSETAVFDTFGWLVIIIFCPLPCVLIFFCFTSMLRVIYKEHNAAHALVRQLLFNNRREHSALIMMSIVVALFLIYCPFFLYPLYYKIHNR